MVTERNLKKIYAQLKKLLIKYAKGGVHGRDTTIHTPASGKKVGYYLYSDKIASPLPGRKPRQVYVAGIIMQKHFVGFYSIPLYTHPKEVPLKHLILKKMHKGKSCININKLDAEILHALVDHVKKGIALYKKIGWI